MTNVTRIDWTVQTGHQWWSGTDDTVKIEIYRDNQLIKRLNLEPGHTTRLDWNELATYFWIFQSPDNIGVSVSGTAVPYFELFPLGVAGHLRVKLVAKGDDAWEKVAVNSAVHSGRLESVPGTIDGVEWVEQVDSFFFGKDVVLSTDGAEGFTEWTLLY
jgi:hypothetical protein